MTFPHLQFVSYLAPNWFWFYEAVAAYVDRTLNVETQIVQSPFDPLADPMLLQDQLDLTFICGLPFIRHHQFVSGQLVPLVAPVMQADRYQDQPVYFSDVIVNSASTLKTFADLKHQIFCYNDPGSNSGYNLLRHRLIQENQPDRFFSKAIQSRAHQRSIEWVIEGIADCAAIDSIVLEQAVRDRPTISEQLRIIESIGPCPMPPLVAARHLGTAVIDRLQSALLQPDAELQAAMQKAGIRRYAAVDSETYVPIARIYDAALGVEIG